MKRFNLKFGLLVLAIALAAAGLYQVSNQTELFKADIGIQNNATFGIPGDAFDPLSSGVPCQVGGSNVLRVTGGGTSYTWQASPADAVLKHPTTGVLSNQIDGAFDAVEFVAPEQDPTDSSIETEYEITVTPENGAPFGPNHTFTIKVAPSCIEKLEFIDPQPGAPLQVDGNTLAITKVRATLFNGVIYEYSNSDLANESLELSIIQNPGIGETIVGASIDLPQERNNITIDMRTGYNNIAPTSLTQNLSTTVGGVYELQSDNVNGDSLGIVDNNGTYLLRDIHYTFVDVPIDTADATNFDGVAVIAGSGAVAPLTASYQFHDPSGTLSAVTPITISSTMCENLQIDLYQGRGQGFFLPEPGVTLPTGSSNEGSPFDFNLYAYDTIVLKNPVNQGQSAGQSIFELKFNFTDTLSERAEITTRNGNNYEISVRNEATPNGTASNFIFAVNGLLEANSPFIAYTQTGNPDGVVLHSTEVGVHTNNYECTATSLPVNCFAGGTAGLEADGVTPLSAVVTDPPMTLEPTIHQGDTRFIYARGGKGDLTWRTSDASIFSIDSLTEAPSDDVALTGEDVIFQHSESLDASDVDLNLNLNSCEYLEDDTGSTLNNCDVTVTASLNYSIAGQTYSVFITPPEGAVIEGTSQGSGVVTGTLTEEKNASAQSDTNIFLSGTLSGGTLTGDVVGTLLADVEITAKVTSSVGNGFPTEGVAIVEFVSGSITLVPNELAPKTTSGSTGETAVSTFAVVSAKRPGTATLFVTDADGCTAPVDIEVVEQKLILEAEGDGTGIYEEGDTIQARAFLGYRGEIGGDSEVTNEVEWISDNTDVATVSETGRISALKPGAANVFARYVSEDAETGTVISEESIPVRVSVLNGLTLTLDDATVDGLPAEARDNVMRSVAIMINSPNLVGKQVVVEDQTVDLFLPIGNYESDIQRVEAIRDQVSADIALLVPSLNVTTHPTLPGIIILTANAADTNGRVDITSTANKEEFTVVPGVSTIALPLGETFQLKAVGEYDNGLTKIVDLADLNFVVTPVARLDDTALEAGLLERGDTSGTSVVYAEFVYGDGTVVTSNSITVDVPSGPQIDFIRILGSGSIERGANVNLSVKVTDFDSINDIADIKVWVVQSAFDTYADIDGDDNAVWFNVQSFDDLIEVTEQVTEEEAESSVDDVEINEIEPVDEQASLLDLLIPEALAQAMAYTTFTIPVQIPQDARLVDGSYKLILQITDTAGFTVNRVIPIFVGAIASGDVNGDGNLNMIDVILAFQIATGDLAPTTSQVEGADIDGNGTVTMIDVIQLFRQATES